MTNPSKDEFVEDLTFKAELFADLVNPPWSSRLGRLEVAINAQKHASDTKSIVHCEQCDDNFIYRAPQNHEVKYTQFSKLTQADMDDALFVRDSPKYGTHAALMKVVAGEQSVYESFLTSLKPKFSEKKAKLPSSWFQYTSTRFKSDIHQEFGNKQHSFRVCSTHVLNGVVGRYSQSIEPCGQIISYGDMLKLKIPKLGHQVKDNVCSLPVENQDSERLVINAKSSVQNREVFASEDHSVEDDSTMKFSEEGTNADTTLLGGDGKVDDSSGTVEENSSPQETAEETKCNTVSTPQDDQKPAPDEAESNVDHSKKLEIVQGKAAQKHVKVAISHDLDVFITNVPVNNLQSNNDAALIHEHIRNFLLGLKVAEVITDIDTICNVFSSSPPAFDKAFLFKFEVSISDDHNKYFKLSQPLIPSSITPEDVTQDILTKLFIQSCSLKESSCSKTEANIAFMEYLLDCGAQLIDKGDGDVKSEVKDFVEPLKVSSFLEWMNLNSTEISNKFYSLFSVSETNMIVHSAHPYFVNFQDNLEKATIYVKPQYCYEFGLEVLSESEASRIYLKALLSDCVGAVIVHVDMTRFTVVHKDFFYLSDLLTKFSKNNAIARLVSFFELLGTLGVGRYLYSHEILQSHSVIYEEQNHEHIQADLLMNHETPLTLSTYTSPVELSKTQLSAWQRHNRRLPLCYHPRRPGTYLCHEYLSRNVCSNNKTCAFAHLTKEQLKVELGDKEFEKFMEDFTKPKADKNGNKPSSQPNFGKNAAKKNSKGGRSKRLKRK